MAIVILAFAAFLLFDMNSVILRSKTLQILFPLGVLLLLIATITEVNTAYWQTAPLESIDYVWLALSAIHTILLVYALFFAIPFSESYTDSINVGSRTVTRTGLYGICRHPGVWFLAFALFFLALAMSTLRMWLFVGLVSFFNLLYALFQDLWTFPRIFSDYNDYRQSVPFLLPRLRKRL
ncbi:MAG: hypothetical protein ACOX54_09070 [Christensenellales bacterium]|jgi:protein-S-isoprenylcysteine O-methyltransferase Ste14|nr:hypothetical protein [Christensenellaceae bacterium]